MKNKREYIIFRRNIGNEYMTQEKPFHKFEFTSYDNALLFTLRQAQKIIRPLNKESRSVKACVVYGYFIPPHS